MQIPNLLLLPTITLTELLSDAYLRYEHEWVPLIAVEIISIVLNRLQLTEEDAKTLIAEKIEKGKPSCILLEDLSRIQTLLKQIWIAMKMSEREDVLAKVYICFTLLNCLRPNIKLMFCLTFPNLGRVLLC